MHRYVKRWVFLILMILVYLNIAFGENDKNGKTVVISSSEIDTIDLVEYTQYWIDPTNKVKPENLPFYKFKPIPKDSYFKQPRQTHWYKLRINNQLEKAISPELYCNSSIWRIYENRGDSLLLLCDNAFGFLEPPLFSFSAETVQIENQATIEFLISSESILEVRKPKIYLIFPENIQENLKERISQQESWKVFVSFILGTILLMGLISFLQYLVCRIPAFKYYTWYLAACFLMYFKNAEWLLQSFGSTGEWLKYHGYMLEPVWGYFMTLGYLLFTQSFLDFKKTAPRVNQLVKALVTLYIGFLILDVFLRFVIDFRYAFALYNYTRWFGFPLFILVIVFLLFNVNKVLYRFVFAGTLFLMLPLIRTLLHHTFEAKQISLNLFIGCHEFSWGTICMYNTRIGLILEMICFFAGLSYLLRKEREEKNKFEQLVFESQAKLNEHSQNDNSKAEIIIEQDGTKILSLPSRNGYDVINSSQILYCAADGNACCIYLKNGKKNLVYKTLKEIDSILPPKDFIRIHASHTVNLNSIVRYIKGEGGLVVLTNNEELKVSRSRKEELLIRLNIS